MSILTFKGGVHPYDGKELSKDVAVRKVNPGKEVVIPVSPVSYTHLDVYKRQILNC